MNKTIFEKIIDREIQAKIIFEDAQCIAFEDSNPQAPIHVLLVTKKVIEQLNDVTALDSELMGHLITKIPEIVKILKINNNYRVVLNNGPLAGQSVYHLHLHILSGRAFQWPPG